MHTYLHGKFLAKLVSRYEVQAPVRPRLVVVSGACIGLSLLMISMCSCVSEGSNKTPAIFLIEPSVRVREGSSKRAASVSA